MMPMRKADWICTGAVPLALHACILACHMAHHKRDTPLFPNIAEVMLILQIYLMLETSLEKQASKQAPYKAGVHRDSSTTVYKIET